MTNSSKEMIDLKTKLSNIKIDGEKMMQVTKIGICIRTSVQRDGGKTKIVLKNVRYIPGIFWNLLSMTQAMKNGFEG